MSLNNSLFPIAVQGSVAAVVLVTVMFLVVYRWRKRKQPTLVADKSYCLLFPPSRRHVVECVSEPVKIFKNTEISPAILQARALPTTRAANFERDEQYTPTGFSIADLRALGRFPNYAILSGVPPPKPCSPDFDISKAIFRPFRPFRWRYQQHMALMKFEPDWWIELDRSYVSTIAARHEFLRKHRDQIFFTYPGSELACRELMEMLLQFMCQRYPKYFLLEHNNTVFVNRLLHTETNLTSTPPLQAIFDNIPEDYALMLRSEIDGLYYLRAAAVCSSVGWDVGMHRNAPLSSIHGAVPRYADRMAPSMERYFARMPTDQPIQRAAWTLEDHAPLFSSPSCVPDGDEWKRSRFHANPAAVQVQDLWLRCDWQTLRRLPLSGAVAFNFKAVLTPFVELRDEPFVPALLLKVLRDGDEELVEHKALPHVRKIAIEALEGWAEEQVAAGIVPIDWEVTTLDESPFFPRWKERWHGQQGF